MIKLNNKNITYVALADTNNSLKAPKEIWYADSANSVKLVYRRKDALIESEDYEKYHWLKGDGTAYIDTLEHYRPYSDSFDLIAKDNKYPNRVFQNDEWIFGLYETINSNILRVGAYIPAVLRMSINIVYYSTTPPVWIDYCVNTGVNSNAIHNIHINKVVNDKYSFDYNGDTFSDKVTVQEFPNNFESQGTLALFNNFDYNVVPFNGAVSKYVHYRDSEVKYDLIPCKLLKPVPKWLDANGIRRQVGECGMIDLVSGKFYGNVNNTGTFSVENYYERKKWLVGDGTAYIDTLHLANEGLDWETHVSNLSFKKYFVWNRHISGETPAISLYHSVSNNGTVRVQNNYTNSIEIQNQTNYDYIVATNSNGAVINGVQYIEQSASEDISNKSIKLFYCDIDELSKSITVIANGGNSQDVKCSYFRFLDSNRNYIQNLIPCTLTMDLPASMDANNIARVKGESGMWDLVSDKFYGNVASSGTFKAVNLAEGVDYEVHQWLVGDGSAYLYLGEVSNYIEFDADIPQADIQFRFVYGNNGALRVNGVYQVFSPLVDANRIKTYNTPLQSKIKIDFDTHLAYSNGEAFAHTNLGTGTNGESAFKSAYFFGNESPTTSVFRGKCAIGNVDMDGNVFTPVKLLKSIPSKYDANGIARQAGECGMYNTVNDKFYGNVASSGTFSVSDDS